MDKKVLIIPASIASVTLLSGAFLLSTKTNADDIVSTATITVPVACTMSGTGTDSHTATIPNGTVQENIGTTTMKVYCNDSEGFSVYTAGFSDDTLGNTYLRDATLGASDDILTGTTFTGTSQWAMKLGATTGTYPSTIAGSAGDSEAESGDTDYSTWAEIPASYTRVAYRNSGTDVNNESAASAEGSSITTTYKAFINSTQKAGTYVGKVKFTMVHPASEEPLQPQPSTAGCINYFANASDAIGTMGCQNLVRERDWSSCYDTDYETYCYDNNWNEINIETLPELDTYKNTLLASNFSRQGYGFAGWSDAYDYTTNPSAHFYGPQETITVPAGTTANGLSLYAVWIKSQGSIQDQSKVANVCSSLTTAPTDGTANLTSVSALTDQRDNNTYAIAKLADGNCWMIENLRLENAAEHNSDGTLAQGYGTSATYGNFGGLADAESANFSDSTTANSLYYSGTQSGDATINIGTTNYPDHRMPRYNNWNNQSTSANRPQNPTSNWATNSTTKAGMYSYGNYYTWHAAIADLTYNDTNNQSTTGTSLCPAGWHLPTGGRAYASGSTSGVNVTGNTSTFREFYNLGYEIMDEVKTAYEDTPSSGYAYYSSNTTNTAGKTATAAFRSFPNNFLYSGFFDLSSAHNRGSDGSYWSSTTVGSYTSYYLYLYSSSVRPGTYNDGKSSGFSIRCTVSAGT